MGHAVLPVYDIRSALHGAGGIREHIGLRARDHGLEPRKGLRHLRHRHVPALTYDRAGLYGAFRLPALCGGKLLPRFLGFHRKHQSAASGLHHLRHILLQQAVRLGLGQLRSGGQLRQRPEGKELDEANMPVCSAHRRGGDIHLRPCNLCLEVRNMSALLTFPFAVV